MVMGFCSKCGLQLPEGAYFCPKCGVKTILGLQTGVYSPYEDMKEVFVKMGQEMEKAFSIAVKEMEKAFETARKNIDESTARTPRVCPNCSEKNAFDSRFCYKCGNAIS